MTNPYLTPASDLHQDLNNGENDTTSLFSAKGSFTCLRAFWVTSHNLQTAFLNNPQFLVTFYGRGVNDCNLSAHTKTSHQHTNCKQYHYNRKHS